MSNFASLREDFGSLPVETGSPRADFGSPELGESAGEVAGKLKRRRGLGQSLGAPFSGGGGGHR
jgi:hypothetical protein